MSDYPPADKPLHPEYTYVAAGTISYHKDLLGWIPQERKYVAQFGANPSITVERLALPTSTADYLMAKISIGGSPTKFYTIETRRFAGYDTQLPGEGAVIHKVNTTVDDSQARVVDGDKDGDPNDDGAAWIPGETFSDPNTGISVSVTGQTSSSSGYTVSINGGRDLTAPKVTIPASAAGATGVAPGTNVTATFSEAMNPNTLRNPDTLRSNTFTLVRKNADGTTKRVAATVTYNATAQKAILNPDSNLKLGAAYIVTVTTGAKDLADNLLDQDPEPRQRQPAQEVDLQGEDVALVGEGPRPLKGPRLFSQAHLAYRAPSWPPSLDSLSVIASAVEGRYFYLREDLLEWLRSR